MSWDVFVQDLPEGVDTVAEIPDDFEPASLGPRAEILTKIQTAVPWADFSDEEWGRIEGDGYSLEIHLGPAQMVRSFSIHARGDRRAIEAIRAILTEVGVRALDPGSTRGIIGPLDEPGFDAWAAYRDHVIATSEDP